MATFFYILLTLDAAWSWLRNGPGMSSVRCMGKELWPFFCHFAAIGCSSFSASKWAKNERHSKHGQKLWPFLYFVDIGCSSVSASKRARNELRVVHGQKSMATFLSPWSSLFFSDVGGRLSVRSQSSSLPFFSCRGGGKHPMI